MPSPDDPNWSEWVDEHLADTEFDSELAKALATGALKVRNGELSATEFQERYHDEVLAEFGVDERPTKNPEKPGVPDTNDRSLDIPPPILTDEDSRRSRREVLKAAGGVAALGITLPGCLGDVGQVTTLTGTGEEAIAATQTLSETGGVQLGMVVDLERCQGELECMVACKEENNTSQGVHWNYVFHYTDTARYSSEEEEERPLQYMPRTCQHCSRPTCTYVCPTEARFKRGEDGIVLTDYDQCIGCRYCEVACPYGVNYFSWGDPRHYDEFEESRKTADGVTAAGNPPGGTMGKCTFCVHRQDSGDPELEGTTACEEACPWGVYSFGDLNNPQDNPQQHLREKEGAYTFHLLEGVGNSPNVIYIGTEPSINAEQTDVTPLKERGFVINRREVLVNSEEAIALPEETNQTDPVNNTTASTPTTEGEE